jgi:hypothetical protein
MRLFAYSIYDVKAQVFHRPFFQQSDGQAVRTFSDIAVDPESEIGKHPEDYSIFRIGEFEDENAALVGEPAVQLFTGLEALRQSRQIPEGSLDLFDKALKAHPAENGADIPEQAE